MLSRPVNAATTCLDFVLDVEEQTGEPFPWAAYSNKGQLKKSDPYYDLIQSVSGQRELAAQAGVPYARVTDAMALLRANRDLLIAVIGGMPMSEAQHEAERGAGVGTTGNRAVLRRGDKRGR